MNFRSLFILLSTTAFAHAQPTNSSREAELQWFDEARFGMFIHWDPYTVPAGDPSSSGDMEVVRVPFPETVPLEAGGTTPPTFFQVSVSSN